MANAWPRWRGAAAEPRIWLILLGGMCLTPRSRGSGATVWEALERRPSASRGHVRLPEGQGARSENAEVPRGSTGAQSCRRACRAGGPRVSETCDRSRRESITRFTPPVHFANGRRSVTVKVTVRGSGFGVRGVVGSYSARPRRTSRRAASGRDGARTRVSAVSRRSVNL